MPIAAWLVLVTSQVAFAMETVYQEPGEFLEQNLSGCQKQVLWLKKDTKSRIEQLVDHPFPGVRVRYCEKEGKTAWVLDEIGKTEPITSGIIIDQGRVEQVRVLVFRESRGSEVHRDAFTRQYVNAELEDDQSLDRYIDGITGATMSVSAVNRQVKLALLLDEVVREKADDR
jgi:hypothetical protein